MKMDDECHELLKKRILDHLQLIYPYTDNHYLLSELLRIMRLQQIACLTDAHVNLWDQSDTVLITYGDSVQKADEMPLKTLKRFMDNYLQDHVSTVHILPFYPYSSDDGFSVINYVEVNQSLGNWQDIKAFSGNYKLMADLVINHCSSRSLWFDNFKQRRHPGMDYFIEMPADTDLSLVVRPRTSPLLRETETLDGTRYVWCTFSHDQIDLNFANPQVLLEFAGIIRTYLDNGISLFRLDAVAFLWKEAGTSSINLPQTHEIIRLLRLLIEHANPQAVVITETNIPNRENLSYFGNANEAHWIYNFSLPPLVLYTLYSGRSHLLKQWLMSMPPAQNGTTYFNFLASHDGIGMRPAEGLLSDEVVQQMADTVRAFGGEASMRSMADGTYKPYELNISLFDAMKGTFAGEDNYQIARFLCAHAIMLALEGVPGIYIHSFLATPNDQAKREASGHNRAINRHNWDEQDICALLDNELSLNSQVLKQMKKLLNIRSRQKAFHPNATQFTMHFSESLFAFWRQSQDRSQSIFCIYNITSQPQQLALQDVNLVDTQLWHDLHNKYVFNDPRESILLEPYDYVWISNV